MKFDLLPFSLLAAVSSVAALPVDGAAPPAAVIFGAEAEPKTWNPLGSSRPPLKTMEQLAPKLEPHTIVDVEPQLRPSAKRQLVRYGPFIMPASKVRRYMSTHVFR